MGLAIALVVATAATRWRDDEEAAADTVAHFSRRAAWGGRVAATDGEPGGAESSPAERIRSTTIGSAATVPRQQPGSL